MRNLVPIGRFSQLCRLTVKALRHYDEQGLLRPALVDDATGYRYYSLGQVGEGERIRLLRALDMPLEEIRAVLREPDAAGVRKRLEAHGRRIEKQIAGYHEALSLLRELLERKEDVMYSVQITQSRETPIVSIREHVSIPKIGEAFGRAYGELFGYLGQLGVRPAGPPFLMYHDQEFKEEDADVEFCVPVERRLSGKGRIDGRVLPAGDVAVTLHAGAYQQIGGAYKALVEWIQQNGREPAGPPRETYLVGPQQAQDPADYRTEISWPVRPAAG